MSKKVLIKFIFGLSILLFFLYKLGFQQITALLLKTNLIIFSLVILCLIPVEMLASLNYSILIKSINKKIPILKIFRLHTLSQAIGKMIPGKIGELSIIKFFNNFGIDYKEAIAITIIDKALSFIFLLIVAISGSIIFFNSFWFLFLFLILAAFLIFFYFIIKPFLINQQFFAAFKVMKNLIKTAKSSLSLNFLVTFFKWLLSFGVVYLLFLGYGEQIEFHKIAYAVAIAKIATFIPISPGGLGVEEVSASFMINLVANTDMVITANVFLLLRFQAIIFAMIMYIINFSILDNSKKRVDA